MYKTSELARVKLNMQIFTVWPSRKARLFCMSSITQDVKYRQSVVEYAKKNGTTRAAIEYRETREFVSRWKSRYDGTLESLKYKSRAPKSNKNAHTPEEIKQIKNFVRRNPHIGLQELWCKLRANGYKRTQPGLGKVLKRLNIKLEGQKDKSIVKYTPKPYEQMTYPGEKVQIDVKVVPKQCLKNVSDNLRLYQYTALDEFSRMRYLEGFMEQSTYSSTVFLDHVVHFFRHHGININEVQTDNGKEFTNRFTSKRGKPTLFEARLQELGIIHHLIKPYTPRHNGKVERSHREDQKRFYSQAQFYSLEDFRRQLKQRQNKSNNQPMKPLSFLSPRQFLARYKKDSIKNV